MEKIRVRVPDGREDKIYMHVKLCVIESVGMVRKQIVDTETKNPRMMDFVCMEFFKAANHDAVTQIAVDLEDAEWIAEAIKELIKSHKVAKDNAN